MADEIRSSTALQRWFGASQIIDADGQPLLVYHGTPDGNGQLLPNGDLTPPRATRVRYYFDSNDIKWVFYDRMRLLKDEMVSLPASEPFYDDYVDSNKNAQEIAEGLPGVTRVEFYEILTLEVQDQDEAADQVASKSKTRHEENEYSYAATLLNPKTNELITVWAHRQTNHFEISIAGDQDSFGASHLDENEGAEDGSPRIHTPHGVNKKGGGYGLMLYCGTAIAVAVKKKYPGVHSTRSGECADRSRSASRIWDKMVDSDLAHTGSGTCGSGGSSDTIDDFCVPIPNRMRDLDDGYVTSSEVCGTVDVERPSNDAEMDILSAKSVIKQGLVVHVEDDHLKDDSAQRAYDTGYRPPSAKLATAKIAEDVEDPAVILTFGQMIKDAILKIAVRELDADDNIPAGTDMKALAEEKATAALIAFLTQPDHIRHLRSSHFLLELLGQQTLFGPSAIPSASRFEGRRSHLGRVLSRLGKIKSIDDGTAAELHEAALAHLDQREGADWAAGFDAFDDDVDPVE